MPNAFCKIAQQYFKIILYRVKAQNADPRPKAELLEVTARFVTTNIIL